jgi:hypothetical protein
MPIKDYRLNRILNPQAGQGSFASGFSGKRMSPFETPPGPQFSFNQNSPDIGDIQEPPEQDEGSKFYDELQRIRNQATPGLTAYQGALQNMPTPDQYKPNWMNRIASGLSGFSAGMHDAGAGIKTAMSLNRAPYEQAMETYTNRLGGLKEQAAMEQQDRTSRMKAIQDAQELGLKYKEYEYKKAESEGNVRARDLTANAASTSAQARMLAAQNAAREEYTYVPVQGGFMVTNKHNPNMPPKVIPANTIQDAQLQVAKGHLAVSQSQLGLNQQTTEASLENTASQIAERDRGKPISPGAQTSAEDLADQRLAQDPEYSKFVGKAGIFGGHQAGPSDFTPGEWARYQLRKRQLIREIESKTR